MNHNNFYDTIIIGGGASGLFLSSFLKSKHLILEANGSVGRKLAITGGGKCNFSNYEISSSNFTGDKALIDSALSELDTKELCKFVASLNLGYEVKNQTQLFLKTNAKDFSLALEKKASKIRANEIVKSVSFDGKVFKISTNQNEFLANKVVVASGGISYAQVGATDVGYTIASSFGHKISTPKPSLVGFTVQSSEFWFKELSGVSLRAKIKTDKKDFVADLLFTHKGISGPVVLNASLYYEKGFLELDFLPDYELKNLHGQKQISTLLPIPKRFIKAFLDNFKLQDKPCNKLNQSDFEILSKLKSYKFAPAGTFGYSKAEITKGGVCGSEINEQNFESKLQKNLFFVGEVLDVNGELGGYNLHFAFASALKCAKYLNSL